MRNAPSQHKPFNDICGRDARRPPRAGHCLTSGEKGKIAESQRDPGSSGLWKHTPHRGGFHMHTVGTACLLQLCYFFAFATNTNSPRCSLVSNLWMRTYNCTSILWLHIKAGDCGISLVFTLVNHHPCSTPQRSGLFSRQVGLPERSLIMIHSQGLIRN